MDHFEKYEDGSNTTLDTNKEFGGGLYVEKISK